MWALAAIIPIIICCVLITGVISVVAFLGMGKNKSNDIVRDGELSQERLRHLTQSDQEKK